jgi:hypothetical protein
VFESFPGKLVWSIRQVQVSENRTSDEWRLLVCPSSDHDSEKEETQISSCYLSCANSVLACFRMGISESASFHTPRKS